MTLGDVLHIDDRTLLLLGQELDFEHDQPDVGNALVHRAGDTLVLVDTGVTQEFRSALRTAVDLVGPWSRILLLTTHGHVDHIGNNDLIDELTLERGVAVEHWVPAADLAQMLDPQHYWESSFARVAGMVPLPAPPKLMAATVVSLFQPLRPFGRTTRTYEERPLELLRIGSVRVAGWTFAGGAVRVLRSQGHCAGSVVVQLRDAGLLHLGDEDNGACGVMQDADQLKLQATFAAAAQMIADGEVALLTDGHTGAVRDSDTAAATLDRLIAQAVTLQNFVRDAVNDGAPVTLRDFLIGYTDRVTELGVGGPHPNPTFTAMMAVNQLRGAGLRPRRGRSPGVWQRPALTRPATPDGAPHGSALLPAAASMVRWKIRGGDR